MRLGQETGVGRLRAWRELHPEAFGANIRELGRFLGPEVRIMAVVKANAYGHGDVMTASVLQEQFGIRDFAVASLEEGIRLRERGIAGRILILGYTPPEALGEAVHYELIQTLADKEYAREAAVKAPGLGAHLKINTGMNRLGVNVGERESILEILLDPRLKIQGIFSHLSMADGETPAEQAFTREQTERFSDLLVWLSSLGCCPGDRHLQSSYGILQGPVSGCNMVRPGIFLYGVRSSLGGRGGFTGTPALSIKAKVAMVRQVEPGEPVSYGNGFHADRAMKLAVLTIGYGDGIPRSLSGGCCLLHGRRAPIAGRICMDQMVVDVSKIPGVRPGDTAVLVGRDGAEEIRAEEMAAWAGTITNELLCRLGDRLLLVTGETKAWGNSGEDRQKNTA